MKRSLTKNRGWGAWVAGAFTSLVAATALGQFTPPAAGPISIPDYPQLPSEYPSTIKVTGLVGSLEKVTVTLNTLTHTYANDVKVMLVSPGGQSVVLMSDAGGGQPLAGVSVLFDDDKGQTLPRFSTVTSGAYRPTNYSGTTLTNAPVPTGTRMADFLPSSPNGDWKLYIADDALFNQGSLGSWTVNLYTTPILTLATNRIFLQEGGTGTIQVNIQDSSTTPENLKLTAVSTDTGLIPNSGLTFSGTGGTRTLTVKPGYLQAGTNNVTVTVEDELGFRSSATFAVNVADVNQRPEIALNVQSVNIVAGTIATNLIAFPSDLDFPAPSSLVLSAASSDSGVVSPGGVTFDTTHPSARPFSIVPTTTVAGSATLSIIVNDGTTNNSAPLLVNVLPSPQPLFANFAPIVLAANSTASSSINIPTISGNIGRLTVSLNGLRLIDPRNLSIALVSPYGTHTLLSGLTSTTPVNIGQLTFQDGGTSTFPTTNTVGGLVLNPATPLSALVNRAANGTWTLWVTNGGVASQIAAGWQIKVFPAPTINSISSIRFSEDASGQVNFTVADLDGTVTSVSAAPVDASIMRVVNASVQNNNAQVTVAGLQDAFGTNDVIVTATDNMGQTATRSFRVEIFSVNDAPDISFIEKQATYAGQPIGPVRFTVTDVDTATNALQITATSDNPKILPNSSILISGTGTNATFMLFPIGTQAGQANVTITVSDGNLSDSSTFTVYVQAPANPLYANTTAIIINPNTNATPYPSTNIVSGLVGRIAEVQVTLQNFTHQAPRDVNVLLVGPNSNSIVLMAKVGGTNQVDNATLVFADYSTNTISETNLVSGVYDLSVGPGTISFPAPAIAPTHGSFAAAFNGTDPNGVWRLYVVDDATGKSFGSIGGGWLLSIRTGPFIQTVAAQQMDENTTKRVEVTVGDIQPGVTFDVTATAANTALISQITVSSTGATRTLLITSAPYSFGATTITVTARDNLGNLSTTSFALTVRRVDLPPVVSSIANVTVPAAQLVGPLPFTAWTPQADRNAVLKVDVSSDNPGLFPAGSITVSGPTVQAVTADPGPRSFMGGTNTFSISLQPAGIQIGTANINVTVSDNFGQKTTIAFRVTVTPSLVYAYEKPITIPLGLPIEGEAIPYPANVPVSGLEGVVQDVRVTLVGLNHTYPADVNVLLVAPDNTTAVLLMSHAGSSNAVANARLTFSDAAATPLPVNAPLVSGTYRPSAYGSQVSLPAPAPAAPSGGYPTSLSAFRNVPPNGDWKVYILDDAFPDSGSVSGGVLLFIDTKPSFKPIASASQITQENVAWPVAINISNSSVNPSNLVVTATATTQDPVNLIKDLVITGFGGARTLWITNTPNQPSATFSPTVKNGTATITVTATDNASGVSSTTTFQYTVVYANQAPRFTQIPSAIQLMDESATNRIEVRFSDVDSVITNKPIVYSQDTTLIPNNPANLDVEGFTTTAKGAEGIVQIKVAPAKFKFGTNTITVVMNDGTGPNNHWITNTITIGVRSVWENPSITRPNDATIVAGTSTNLNFTVGSNDVDPSRLRVFAVSGNGAIIPSQYLVLSGSAAARTIRLTSIGTMAGTVPITVFVTDDIAGTNSTTFNVTVTAPTVANRIATFANTTQIDVNGVARASAYPSLIEIPQAGVSGRIAKLTVLIDGLTHNNPAALDLMLVHPNGTTAVMLMSGAGDATVIGTPIRVTFDDAGSPLPLDVLTEGTYHPGNFTKRTLPDAPATFDVNLSAFNGLEANGVWRLYAFNNAGTGRILAGWTLRITTAPTITITGTAPSPVVIQENGSATLALSIRDDYATAANGFTVTVASSNPALLPSRNVTANNPGSLDQQWTIRPELYQSGEAVLTFTVRRNSDGATASVTLSPNVIVNPVNVPPTFSRIPDITINANQTGTAQFLLMDGDTPLQDLIITATSENQAIVRDVNLRFNGRTNTLYGLPATAVPQVSLLNLSITPEITGVGTTRILLTVTDPAKVGTNTVTAFLWLTVNQYLVPPVISSVPNQTITSGAAVDNIVFWVASPISGATFTVTGVANPSGYIQQISATPVSGNPTNWMLRIQAADVVTDETPKTASITLTATANNSATASTTFVVTIIPKRERSYTNTMPIVINDNAPATPYPSTIKVDDLAGAVRDVKVRLNGFTHTFPSDVAVMLVSPGGQKVVLTDRAGQGGGAVNGLQLTFDQNASVAIPGSSTLTSGSWRPAGYRAGTFNFMAPAPAGPYATNLTAITGAASGTWSLYVMDDMLGDAGAITNGWTLSITTQPIVKGLTDVFMLEGTTVEQPFTIADDTRSASPTYQLSGTSSVPGVIPNSAITFVGSGTNRTVRVTPATYGSNVVVTVFVTNSDGQTVQSSFRVDVGYNKTAPIVANIPDAAISAGSVFTTGLSFSDLHTPLNQLGVGVDSSNQELVPAANIKRSNITNLTVAPVGNLTGTTVLTLSVTNSDGLFTQRSFVLTVNPSTTPLFASTNRIVINDLNRANPYPSPVTVAGLSGTITKVTVTLNSLQHTFPQDISVLLSAPSGTNVVLMSRAGGALAVSNVRVAFDDAASQPVPQSGTLNDGTYRPSDYKASDSYFSPAPVGPYSKVLSDLIGTDPNGTWSLWVQDDATPDVGAINGGWTLSITTTTGKALLARSRGVSLVITQTGDDVQVTVSGTPGVQYGIQTSSDMSNWSESGSVTADDAGKAQYTLKAGSGLQLFRAVAK